MDTLFAAATLGELLFEDGQMARGILTHGLHERDMRTALLRQNVGVFDRVVRTVLGLDMLAIAVYGPRTAWGWLGLIALATVLVGTCPLYTALGIDTRRARSGRPAAPPRPDAAPGAPTARRPVALTTE